MSDAGDLKGLVATREPDTTEGLVVTRTPFRITLGGGGSDLPSYYEQHGGCCVAMAINRSMYVTVNRPVLDSFVRLHYSRTETADEASDLEHDLAREALAEYGLRRRVEIASMADLPSGAGLGSSAAYTVGLLAALARIRGRRADAGDLARQACDIEINRLGRPVGKQDQYTVAYGGIVGLTFHKTGEVSVQQIRLPEDEAPIFCDNVRLYQVNALSRSAPDALAPQAEAMADPNHLRHVWVEAGLNEIADIGRESLAALRARRYEDWAHLQDLQGKIKASLGTAPVNPDLVEIYAEAVDRYGCMGGRLIGAGGGGFLMLYCAYRHEAMDAWMATLGLRRLVYGIDHEGVQVLTPFGPSHELSRMVR